MEIWMEKFHHPLRLWNEVLARRIRELPKKEFKGEGRRLRFDILTNENGYIETAIIVRGLVN